MEEKIFCNVAAYKFITIDSNELTNICKNLKKLGLEYDLKGTILLSTEGINLFLAGERNAIENFQQQLAAVPLFADLQYKYSYSQFVPFKKLIVKIRNEIVTFKQEAIKPEKFTAPYLTPQELKAKLASNQKMILLDTRNMFEYEIGTFQDAIHLEIENFRDLPEALEKNQGIDKNMPIVTFCTGGIRCEKAAAFLLEQGFKEVYQLQGGILNYFEQCGGEFYHGNCFVFDDRISINSKLEPVTEVIPDIKDTIK